jgi:hypothetical protein
MPGDDTIRTVEVRPPSASGETRIVLRVAAAITFGALFVAALRAGDAPQNGQRSGDLLPFQLLFRDAPPPIQRMYRDLQEGLIEAENTRAASKRWPAVATLAAEGIPPFGTLPAYTWRLAQDGVYVNYLGVPAPGSDRPAFLALIQEPEPGSGETAAALPLDEVHHRLVDGTLLHVSIWFRAADVVPADQVLTAPFASGWTQVLVGSQGP